MRLMIEHDAAGLEISEFDLVRLKLARSVEQVPSLNKERGASHQLNF